MPARRKPGRPRKDPKDIKERPGPKNDPTNKKGGHPRGWQNPEPPTPTTTKTRGDICGANRSGKSTSGPGICCQPAGWGTTHVGIGHCKLHGGATPSGEISAAKEDVSRKLKSGIYGEPKEIGPHEAMLEEIHRTSGHIEWLRDLIDRMGDKEGDKAIAQITQAGMTASHAVSIYQDERKHLVNVCKAAVGMGVAERQVQLAEEQGKLMAMVINAIFADPELSITPQQRTIAPAVIRRHLQAVPIETTAQEVTKEATA